MKTDKGITMVVLVVTIIVLILLAGVSINMLVGDNGIITKAQQARENISLSQIEEQTALNELYEEMNQEGIYIEDEESNKKDEMIKSLQEQLEEQEKEIEELKRQLMIYKLGEGDYIKYDTGVEGVGIITCRVLYPLNSEYGLQVISDKSVETITLGGSTFEEGRISYNNAIETLNNAAEKYRNAEYATDVRCVGSMPTVENGVFINKNSETAGPTTLPFLFNGSTSVDCKGEDTNYTTDQEQMQDLEILMTGQSYWLASRNVHSNSSSICYFNVRAVFSTTGLNADCLCRVYTGEPSLIGFSSAYGLRPCILLKTDIKLTGGDGKTEETAYIIQ